MWKIEMSKMARKDAAKVKKGYFQDSLNDLLAILAANPFQNPPPYKKLEPPSANAYSRRINDQHRLTYTVNKTTNIVKIRRMWTHYE